MLYIKNYQLYFFESDHSHLLKCSVRTWKAHWLRWKPKTFWWKVYIRGRFWIYRAWVLSERLICGRIFHVFIAVAKRPAHKLNSGVIVSRSPEIVGWWGICKVVALQVAKTGGRHKAVLLVGRCVGKLDWFTVFNDSVQSVNLKIIKPISTNDARLSFSRCCSQSSLSMVLSLLRNF